MVLEFKRAAFKAFKNRLNPA